MPLHQFAAARCLGVVLAACTLISLGPVALARAASAPDRGEAWEPKVISQPLYGTKPPSEDPDVQRHYVEAHDGVDLYVETWLPAEKDGHAPPAKIPTILIMTPYVIQGAERYPAGNNRNPAFIEYFTQRGYAVAQHHVRGTGESGGCLEQTAENQWTDGAYVVEYLGRDAPWSNGRVGMYGRSYDAETQISTAAYGDPVKTKYLKAIIPTASVGSQYDWNFMDGVPWTGQPLVGNASYLITTMEPGAQPAPQHYPEKVPCQVDVMGSSANTTGDYTDYWRAREYRAGAGNVRAATLMIHGLRDFNVQPITLAGFFDRLPRSTPHKGLFGVFQHAYPSGSTVEPDWSRLDWYPMVTSWFDHYLKGLDTRVQRWPDVQVQGSDGQWWAAPEFPTTGGPAGHLALGPDGALGAERPEGSTTYTEQLLTGEAGDGEAAVFTTPALKAPLHITGQPVVDVWLQSSEPDAHVAVELEVLKPDGEPLRHPGEAAATYGVRSLQHIAPMKRGWFEQEHGEPVPAGEAVHVIVRFLPTDLVVPAGGKVRLTIAGSVSYSKGESVPSGARSTITILHDCDYTSALRFLMPQPSAPLLNVREPDEKDAVKLTSKPARIGTQDGGGLATRAVCGRSPHKVAFLEPGGESLAPFSR